MNDKTLLYPEFTTMPFGYYYKKDSNYVGINSSFDINRTIANGNRIWLITSHMQYKERREDLELIEERLYSSMYTNEDVVKFYGIRIYLYDNVKKR